MISMNYFQRRWTISPKSIDREQNATRKELQSEPAANIVRNLQEILGNFDEGGILEWEKAILAAKAGPRRQGANPEQTVQDRRYAFTGEETKHLDAERTRLSSQKGLIPVIVAVALAAFLQGHVQSSINAGSLFAKLLEVTESGNENSPGVTTRDWETGAMNASPFLAAALLGTPASLPTNYYIGRRGSLMVSAVLIIASSVASAFANTWQQLLGYRIIGGIGMGVKAVSAPILAAESVTGFWRGSIMITWQLWVACGIMAGFVVNLAIASIADSLHIQADDIVPGSINTKRALQFILGAPIVPCLGLMIAVYFCYESPRFYMRQDSPNFNPQEALRILFAIRPSKLQARRDFILIRWSTKKKPDMREKGLTYASQLRVVVGLSVEQYRTLLKTPRLRNALWSTCTVNLAQQLCGINVFAFYSNEIFSKGSVERAMLYSLGFGMVNFFFCLPAMRTIDTSGRRAWLLATLPIMCLMLVGAAVADPAKSNQPEHHVTAIVFIFLFAAAYSPGLGPIPFTLASESFPLSHREAGASAAICVNLFFAAILAVVLPAMNSGMETRGLLGFFAGMNVIAFVLVYLLVEETRWVTLEDLDVIYNHPKSGFVRYQIEENLPWAFKRYILFQRAECISYDEYLARADNANNNRSNINNDNASSSSMEMSIMEAEDGRQV